jgi:hypothetical protein
MKKIEITLLKRLIRLRAMLDKVSQISWSFSVLNKQYPIGELLDEEAQELIASYEELLKDLKELLEK